MASESSSSQLWNHDVFLSFRGEDTRKTFVDHLYTSLVQHGIHTYKDDETLPRGESIGPALLKAIRESRIAVIVFSENYADSSWCLDELEYIMKCRDERGQIVLPVFYHVDPSDIRKQKRKYGEAFAKYESENNNKVESWRKALADAGNLSGWVPKDIANGHESKGIKEIVDTISDRLFPIISNVDEELIGIRGRLQDLKSVLEIGSDGVLMVGIWGVGGGGKSTLASSVYDEISSKFDGCCFVENIREKSSKHGLEILQEKVIVDVLKQNQMTVRRVEEGRRMIKSRLCHRKVLIVLDDVDHLDHLKALAGSHDWFGEGSRIIITTRDKHLLNAHKVNVIHIVRLLNDDEAIKLFRKHAHQDYRPIGDYDVLSKDVVSYAGGLPLALKVLGCFLCDKDMNEWQSALDRLKEIPDIDVVEKLKISFDGLKQIEKELFLDIACFFRGELKYDAMTILDACGLHSLIGVKVLLQKALVIITSKGEFDMHDLVQEMGHYIVRGEHPKSPEKHTRVWHRENILNICVQDATTELDEIKAIRYYCYRDVTPQRLLHVFANMKRLRLIDLRMCQKSKAALPLPENFPPRELCCLMLNQILQKQLWKGYKYLPNLKMMKLDGLLDLVETPDFGGLPNLERFLLRGSPNLKGIHPSIGRMERLVFLKIERCDNLRMFPPITRSHKLETLELSRCPKLFHPLDVQQKMDNAKHCNLDETVKEEDPICCLEEEPRLPHNSINNHRGFRFFHRGLRKLILSYCNLGDEDISSDFWELPNLRQLNLVANKISRLPCSVFHFPQLKWLDVSECRNLVELSGLPPSIAVLGANDCDSLEIIGDISNCKWLWKVSLMGNNKLGPLGGDVVLHSMLQGNAIEHHFISLTHDYTIPEGFADRLIKVKIYTLQLPHNWRNDYSGFLIRIVSEMLLGLNIFIKHEDSHFELCQESDEVQSLFGPDCDADISTFEGYIPFTSLRHTTWLNSACNMLTFSLDNKYEGVFGAELVPRKYKDDPVQTAKVVADCSEFWDEEYGNRNTFTIQHDSESSLEIIWRL